MTAQIRIYNGAVANPESDLLRTIIIEDIKSITAEDGSFKVNRINGETISFDVETSKIIIE